MIRNLKITRVESKVQLPEAMLENYLNSMHHPQMDVSNTQTEPDFSSDYKNIQSCGEYIWVDGDIEIGFSTGWNDLNRYIQIPVVTGFWVVCTRENKGNFRVTWNSSLS